MLGLNLCLLWSQPIFMDKVKDKVITTINRFFKPLNPVRKLFELIQF